MYSKDSLKSLIEIIQTKNVDIEIDKYLLKEVYDKNSGF